MRIYFVNRVGGRTLHICLSRSPIWVNDLGFCFLCCFCFCVSKCEMFVRKWMIRDTSHRKAFHLRDLCVRWSFFGRFFKECTCCF